MVLHETLVTDLLGTNGYLTDDYALLYNKDNLDNLTNQILRFPVPRDEYMYVSVILTILIDSFMPLN